MTWGHTFGVGQYLGARFGLLSMVHFDVEGPSLVNSRRGGAPVSPRKAVSPGLAVFVENTSMNNGCPFHVSSRISFQFKVW